MKKLILTSVLIVFNLVLFSQDPVQQINPTYIKNYWKAKWINHPTSNSRDYGVYHFRKLFNLSSKPDKFIVHVSADNRYRLIVNGIPVCFGPARSDLMHWNFETIDIAKYLKPGNNVIAALVWNMGEFIPWAQMTLKTAFILQGNSGLEDIVNTDNSWKVTKNEAYSPLPVNNAKLQTFIVVGPGDKIVANKYPWGWQDLDYDDSKWLNPAVIQRGQTKGNGTGIDWDLVPRDIPMMEESPIRLTSVCKSSIIKVSDKFLKGEESLTIPIKSAVVILFDQTYLTTAYPELLISGGKNSRIKLTYAEALFNPDGTKGNRNQTEKKIMKGNEDLFIADGGEKRLFRPLWLRTFRYLEMEIRTEEQPLVINDFHAVYTGYPFKENASFKCEDSVLSKIWETGWRTLRLCSHETHFDCPYYEQLQYVGDTRIQTLVSLYVSGDDRLMRKAINCFDMSRFSEGLTCSRYPSNTPQVIPTFSLFWTNMVHDYWMLRDDHKFVGQYLFGIQSVFNWYENKIDSKTGMLGETPYWNFVDWPKEWPWDNEISTGGVPAGGSTGGSSITTLQFAYALNEASGLFEAFNKPDLAKHYKELAQKLTTSTVKLCWDDKRQIIANTPEKKEFSQHANIMAILASAQLPVDAKDLIVRIAEDKSLIQATFYYRFYLSMAMKKVGLADKYIDMLDPWKKMLDMGLTTFAEKPEETRSDCHAWSASPNYEFLATVCGIEPDEPGFKSVRIEPHLGPLQWVEGQMPHLQGLIKVKFNKSGNGIEGEINLPIGLKGKFIFQGKEIELKEGVQKVKI